jgi:hypothetical protein
VGVSSRLWVWDRWPCGWWMVKSTAGVGHVLAGLRGASSPNLALEPTPRCVRSCVAPASGRGSPLAFGGPRGGWWTERRTHERRWGGAASGAGAQAGPQPRAGLCWAPWGRGTVAQAAVPATPEPRTGADRPQRQLVPRRASVGGGGGSPRAFGSRARTSAFPNFSLPAREVVF